MKSEIHPLDSLLGEIEELLLQAFEQGWLPYEMLPSFRKAWSASRAEVREFLVGPHGEDRLSREGLSGPSLAFKVMTVRWLKNGFEDARRQGKWARAWRKVTRRLSPMKAAFKGILSVANAILDSVGNAIPGGHALKELKDTVEGGLEWAWSEPKASRRTERGGNGA